MLWLKALHIVFVVTWFVGLFCLPRMFVHHATVTDRNTSEHFKRIEAGLFRITTLGGMLAVAFGIATLLQVTVFAQQLWMQLKLMLVLVLIGYHVWCYRLLLEFRRDANTRGRNWYRLFNELPTVLLIAIVLLVVVKKPL
jgi:protoporphyrinogen IX oxidase